MKLLQPEQIKELDAYTIAHEPICSIDLMKRAATKCYNWFKAEIGVSKRVLILCGVGNNGGDGLVLAQLLCNENTVTVLYLKELGNASPDNILNLKRTKSKKNISFITVDDYLKNEIDTYDVCIDAIYGIDFRIPLPEFVVPIIEKANSLRAFKLALDIPSGLPVEVNADELNKLVAFKAHQSLTFHAPKFSFLFPETFQYVGNFETLDIGLNTEKSNSFQSNYFYTDSIDVKQVLKKRTKYSHKGTYGHSLLIGGEYGKAGAVYLSALAALRIGSGLVSIHTCAANASIVQALLPEAMLIENNELRTFDIITYKTKFKAIGIGPGLGTLDNANHVLKSIIQNGDAPLVLDADALNILSENKTWFSFLPTHTILTPHPLEFDRLTEKHNSDIERFKAQIELSKRYNVIIILKGAHTRITLPDGNCYFNSTGCAAMATGGSGDVLTGVITGLLAQGYAPQIAAVVGVYLHGLAGELSSIEREQGGVKASEIADALSYVKNKFY